MSSDPPSRRAASGDHRPAQPSNLRHSHRPSSMASSVDGDADADADNEADAKADATASEIESEPQEPAATESTPLISGGRDSASSLPPAHAGVCTHGTFSPRAETPEDPLLAAGDSDAASSIGSGAGTNIPVLDSAITTIVGSDSWKRRLGRAIRTKKMGQSNQLAEQAGVHNTTLMYLSYYVPCLTWIQQYQLSFLKGDIIAALTMASFYLPMALSYASNLAHVPPIHGLYAFIINPFVYAIFGSCPQLVVGPEAAGSLLVGAAVKHNVDSGGGEESNDQIHARVCGVITGMAGGMVLIAGLVRLGFLDGVLSRPFLRGFISAIGFVIAVDQLIPELGLTKLADEAGISHGSSVDKIGFLVENIHNVHMPTFAVAGISFVIIVVCRELKKHLQPRYPSVVFIPDRFIIVVLSVILCGNYRWDKLGVEILGPVKTASGKLFVFQWPFQASQMPYIRDGMSTSFLIALLGFFESSVAAKSLGGVSTIQGMQLSANRELVALGVANLVGGSFLSLPAFGGYGRSKVNVQTGGKSPMSSVFLSIISLLCVLFLLPYFYYLPKPVLSSMISAIAFSLMEEAPNDISFFWKIRGWVELGLMMLIFLATIFYSLTLGMALGVGVSLLMVIRHSTRPRIQILGRIPNTTRFENAELDETRLEFIEGCLIVKIPEPLTFANTGELKSRLRRLEMYGTPSAHPALPRLRSSDSNRNIIFDVHGVTSIDGSGLQVLAEIVSDYRERRVRVFFSRGPRPGNHSAMWRQMVQSGIVDMCGGEDHFVNDVEEALRRTEIEESIAEEM